MGDNRSPVSHMTGNAVDFYQKIVVKLLPVYKTVEKIATVVKKVAVFVNDHCFFCSFSGIVQGLLFGD